MIGENFPSLTAKATSSRLSDAAEEALTRLLDEVPTLKKTLTAPEWREVAARIVNHSPHLLQLLRKHPEVMVMVAQQGLNTTWDILLQEMQPCEDCTDSELMSYLRRWKARGSLLISIADLTQHWTPREVTQALSQLADISSQKAFAHLYASLVTSGTLNATENMGCDGLFMLALGKLGAQELNYSSDIDVLILFDASRLPYNGDEPPRRALIQLANRFIQSMQERTADGYVFRTDMRLRPDPASTPLVMSTDAALGYYESVGQNWERAALIRARAIAGDMVAAQRFLSQLQPFIWRKYLDFAAIADIESIKRQIDNRADVALGVLDGFNLKVGAGGIRDIEFFTQTQQLIWGGKLPSLRQHQTEEALLALADEGIVAEETAQRLIDAYWHLRRCEHAAQMIHDEQTHQLPSSGERWQHFSALLGYASVAQCQDNILDTLQCVYQLCRPLFQEHGKLSAETADGGEGRRNLVFTGVEDDPDTLETLRSMGFQQPDTVSRLIRGWHSGNCPAMQTTRSRELLTELTPPLLAAFSNTRHPNSAISQFADFFQGLPAGVQLLSFFASNAFLLELTAKLFGDSPKLAEMLKLEPRLLDRLLTADLEQHVHFGAVLKREMEVMLSTSRGMEDSLMMLRQLHREYRFYIAVQLLTRRLSPDKAASYFSITAQTLLDGLLQITIQEFEAKHGVVAGGHCAFLALGKLGSGQMSFESDLDVIFVYDWDHSDKADATPGTYYNRLLQRLLTGASALMKHGRLFEVDLRLRPFGNDSPKATALDAFRRYYDETAWSFEWLALTRARPVAGNHALQQRLSHHIRQLLARPHDARQLAIDIMALREKIGQSYPRDELWNVKYHEGGILDLELAIQYLQLIHATRYADILTQRPLEALAALALHDAIEERVAHNLSACLTGLLAIQQWQRIIVTERDKDAALPDYLIDALKTYALSARDKTWEEILGNFYRTGYKHLRTILNMEMNK